jgi:hypothetical protein
MNGGSRPLWSRDGHELFYLDAERRMTVLLVNTQSGFTFGKPKTLFNTTQFGLEGAATISTSRSTVSAF